jgi:hypothetical protein
VPKLNNKKTAIVVTILAALGAVGALLYFTLGRGPERTWEDDFNAQVASHTPVDFTSQPARGASVDFTSHGGGNDAPYYYLFGACTVSGHDDPRTQESAWRAFEQAAAKLPGSRTVDPVSFYRANSGGPLLDGGAIAPQSSVVLTIWLDGTKTPDEARQHATQLLLQLRALNPCRAS